MGIGVKTDFKIYQEEFFGGFTEVAMQNANVFNEASANTVRLIPARLKGDYAKQSFFTEVASLITRRDVTSTGAVTDILLAQGEKASVKLNRKIGPIADTLDAFRKIQEDPQIFSLIVGQQTAKAAMVEQVKMVCKAATTALANVSAVLHDYSGTGIIDHTQLATGLSKFGDNQANVKCWIMHSKVYFDLVGKAIADKITNIADVVINGGLPGTLGRPVIVTDAADLIIAGTPTKYYTLGLVEDGVTVEESEERAVESQLVTGLENLVMRIQGEYAYNLGLKGFTWDYGNGGANPADATVATATNWDKIATDNKSLAGVIIKTQ